MKNNSDSPQRCRLISGEMSLTENLYLQYMNTNDNEIFKIGKSSFGN
jgi:hypothetical protein